MKESLWKQWWVRLGLWIILFGIISEVSPTPVIPGLFFIGSVIVFIISKVIGSRRKEYDYYGYSSYGGR